MTIRTPAFAATAAALVVASLLATTASYAQDAPAGEDGPQTWAVQPADASGPDGRGQLDYVIEPGDIYEDRIAVRNFGEGPLTVTLEVFDAAQTPENGFELGEPGDEQRGVGAWFELPEGPITVEPRSFTVVPFTFDVPVDAEPGDHAGGIVAASLVDPAQTGAVMQYRVGTRVHVRVAGPVEPSLGIEGAGGAYSGSLVPFSSGEVGIEAMLTNGGNVRLSPAVTVTARSLFGLWKRSATVEGLDELLPQGAASLAESIGGVPQIGPVWVTLEATGVESRGQDLTGTMDLPEQTVVVWAVPWVLLGIVLLLIVALVLLLARSFRRKIES